VCLLLEGSVRGAQSKLDGEDPAEQRTVFSSALSSVPFASACGMPTVITQPPSSARARGAPGGPALAFTLITRANSPAFTSSRVP
jgi:hypothetical protein